MFYKYFFFFQDHTARCQWFDCSVIYVSHPVMKTDETYEIERLIIQFFKTDEFILNKSCWKYDNKDVYVTVNCEAKYIQGNGYIKNVFRSNLHTKTSQTNSKMYCDQCQ